MRRLVFAAAIFFVAGCGGGESSSDSYTAKALEELRAGNTADAMEKRRAPKAAEIAVVKKRVKAYPAGSKRDLYQALWILSNQREHEELHFNTMAKSTYVIEAYKRVFGPMESINSRDEPNTWAHTCTDGKVTLRGVIKVKGQPELMMMYPPKPK